MNGNKRAPTAELRETCSKMMRMSITSRPRPADERAAQFPSNYTLGDSPPVGGAAATAAPGAAPVPRSKSRLAALKDSAAVDMSLWG